MARNKLLFFCHGEGLHVSCSPHDFCTLSLFSLPVFIFSFFLQFVVRAFFDLRRCTRQSLVAVGELLSPSSLFFSCTHLSFLLLCVAFGSTLLFGHSFSVSVRKSVDVADRSTGRQAAVEQHCAAAGRRSGLPSSEGYASRSVHGSQATRSILFLRLLDNKAIHMPFMLLWICLLRTFFLSSAFL